MTSNEFLEHANNSAVINAFEDERVKQHVKNYANKKRIKALLYLAGTRILNMLLAILEAQIIKKYGYTNHKY